LRNPHTSHLLPTFGGRKLEHTALRVPCLTIPAERYHRYISRCFQNTYLAQVRAWLRLGWRGGGARSAGSQRSAIVIVCGGNSQRTDNPPLRYKVLAVEAPQTEEARHPTLKRGPGRGLRTRGSGIVPPYTGGVPRLLTARREGGRPRQGGKLRRVELQLSG
jgi:hypothetical protein